MNIRPLTFKQKESIRIYPFFKYNIQISMQIRNDLRKVEEKLI